MYYFKEGGKQVLDLAGDLVITHNKNTVIARVKSAAPTSVKNGAFIVLNGMGFVRKIRATFAAVRFIWGRVTAIDEGAE